MPVNIGSLRKNINLFIANIHNVKRDIDIITMSEMWIFKNKISHYKIPEYKSFGKMNDYYRAGGVIIYVIDHITVQFRQFNMEYADVLVLRDYI